MEAGKQEETGNCDVIGVEVETGGVCGPRVLQSPQHHFQRAALSDGASFPPKSSFCPWD